MSKKHTFERDLLSKIIVLSSIVVMLAVLVLCFAESWKLGVAMIGVFAFGFCFAAKACLNEYREKDGEASK